MDSRRDPASKLPKQGGELVLVDWIPQRGEDDNAIAALKNLLLFQRVRITETTIEQELAAEGTLEPLRALQTVLDRWHFATEVRPLSRHQLEHVTYPAVCLTNRRLVVLGARDGERVRYLDPGRGWREATVTELAEHDGGRLLVAAPGEQTRERDYEVKREKELAERARRQSAQQVRIVEDFLAPHECRHLIELATPLLRGSVVRSGNEMVRYQGRTSSSAFLEMPDEVIEEIYDRASRLLDEDSRCFEPLQCSCYQRSQEYEPHFDAFEESHEVELAFGQRTLTLLAYLNDDFEAGETLFPRMGMKIRPRRGRAVIFRSTDEAGKILPDSFHAGLPVLSGTKYVMNLWTRDRWFPRRTWS